MTHTVALVGYAAAGLGGALVATAVAFAPSFAFVMLGAPTSTALRGSRHARAFLDGAGPAAAGAILGAAVPLLQLLRGRLAVAACSPPRRSRCCVWVPPIWVLVGRRGSRALATTL